MKANGFDAKVRQHRSIAIIDMIGEVNASAEKALGAAYTAVEELGASSLLLNFSSVDYINSTGIALIVGILARARKDRRDVMASGLTDHYRKIFDITRVSDFMRIYEDEQSAISA
jgi:anti-sigma B factor antagonist